MKLWSVAAGVAAALVCVSAAQAAQSALVARGDYIVNRVGSCNDCHSPLDRMGMPIPGRELTGTKLDFASLVPVPG